MARFPFALFALLLAVSLAAACGDSPIPVPPRTSGTAGGAAVEGEPPGPPWGGAVMGLRVGHDPAKKVLGRGEDLVLTIRAENCLDKPLKLPHFADGAWGFQVTLQGNREGNDYTVLGPALDDSPANDYVLKPGEVWSKQINLSRNGRISKAGGGTVDALPPDIYEIFGGYTNRKGSEYWVGGHCWTNGVTIEIK